MVEIITPLIGQFNHSGNRLSAKKDNLSDNKRLKMTKISRKFQKLQKFIISSILIGSVKAQRLAGEKLSEFNFVKLVDSWLLVGLKS